MQEEGAVERHARAKTLANALTVSSGSVGSVSARASDVSRGADLSGRCPGLLSLDPAHDQVTAATGSGSKTPAPSMP